MENDLVPNKDMLGQKQIIAYIDVLGTRDALKNGNIELFETLYASLEIARITTQKNAFFTEWCRAKIKGFSDNFIIAIELNDEDYETVTQAFTQISFFLRVFVVLLLQKGILIRGAISLGELYIDEVIVWGKALVDAVELEENIAIFPRILISTHVINKLKQNDFADSDKGFEYAFKVLKDDDGNYSVNIFDPDTPVQSKQMIDKIRNKTLKKIEVTKRDRVLQKLQWYLNYLDRSYNAACIAVEWWKKQGVELEKHIDYKKIKGENEK